jgi:hypothetical protein
MESFMDGATLVEATLLSFFLALWVTWMGLRGLFRLMPGGRLEVVPTRVVRRQGAGATGNHGA